MAEISVVIPVFREAACLTELHRRLKRTLASMTPEHEILFVEDGGGDESWSIIAELAAADVRTKGLKLTRNFGQHNAISAGLHHADGDWVAVMDADLQDPPEAIPLLYDKAREGYHVVAAVRAERVDGWRRQFLARQFAKVFSVLTGLRYDARISVFRLLSRQVVDSFRAMPEKHRFFAGIIEWLGYPTATVEVQHGGRFAGATSYDLRRLLALALGVIIGYSDRPLRLLVGLGLAIAALAFLAGSYILILALFYDGPVVGWASLIVSLYFMGGLIIVNIGVVGLYLGRVFDETKNRPLYVVLDRLNIGSQRLAHARSDAIETRAPVAANLVR